MSDRPAVAFPPPPLARDRALLPHVLAATLLAAALRAFRLGAPEPVDRRALHLDRRPTSAGRCRRACCSRTSTARSTASSCTCAAVCSATRSGRCGCRPRCAGWRSCRRWPGWRRAGSAARRRSGRRGSRPPRRSSSGTRRRRAATCSSSCAPAWRARCSSARRAGPASPAPRATWRRRGRGCSPASPSPCWRRSICAGGWRGTATADPAGSRAATRRLAGAGAVALALLAAALPVGGPRVEHVGLAAAAPGPPGHGGGGPAAARYHLPRRGRPLRPARPGGRLHAGPVAARAARRARRRRRWSGTCPSWPRSRWSSACSAWPGWRDSAGAGGCSTCCSRSACRC